MFESHVKGELAQLEFQKRALEKGIIVSRPTTESRYDYIIDDKGELLRAQIKYAGSTTSNSNGSVLVRLEKECRSNGKRRCYSSDEVDVLFVFIPQINKICRFDTIFFVDKSTLTIRIETAKNRQTKNVYLAQDFIW